jgi:hypothetical protein
MELNRFLSEPLPGDEVAIDFSAMGIPIPEDYECAGMVIRENRPIHTYVYKVMLYPRSILDNSLKIIEVDLKYIKIMRYLNMDHYELEKSHLSSTYGRMINNGKTKQSN